jgi:hypothetical protein
MPAHTHLYLTVADVSIEPYHEDFFSAHKRLSSKFIMPSLVKPVLSVNRTEEKVNCTFLQKSLTKCLLCWNIRREIKTVTQKGGFCGPMFR